MGFIPAISHVTRLFCCILQNMSPKFEVNDLFLIKGRGHVIVGWIREGVVKVGMTVSISSFPQKLVIQGIEMISTVNRPKELQGVVGLLFPSGNEQDNLIWKNLDIHNTFANYGLAEGCKTG